MRVCVCGRDSAKRAWIAPAICSGLPTLQIDTLLGPAASSAVARVSRRQRQDIGDGDGDGDGRPPRSSFLLLPPS